MFTGSTSAGIVLNFFLVFEKRSYTNGICQRQSIFTFRNQLRALYIYRDTCRLSKLRMSFSSKHELRRTGREVS